MRNPKKNKGSYRIHRRSLAKEGKKYTTFIMSCGRGTRAPQGLNMPGDWFNFHSDQVFRHLDGMIKLVDDVLV